MIIFQQRQGQSERVLVANVGKYRITRQADFKYLNRCWMGYLSQLKLNSSVTAMGKLERQGHQIFKPLLVVIRLLIIVSEPGSKPLRENPVCSEDFCLSVALSCTHIFSLLEWQQVLIDEPPTSHAHSLVGVFLVFMQARKNSSQTSEVDIRLFLPYRCTVYGWYPLFARD